jgi:TonB family protein
VKEANRMILVCLLVLLAGASGGSISLKAQMGDISGTRRKVIVLAKPQYPEIAKKLSLSGVVKIEVTIEPNGKVKRTRVLGGHPVLAQEAERAAMQSEFEPGPKETTEIIEFKFNSQ